jgi:ATP-dependent DNA helicase RecQ
MSTRSGVRAETINSTNRDDWERIEDLIRTDEVDLLLVSPERLANQAFRRRVFDTVIDNVGLLVVDEVHCISDWGHDFRPDYRRVRAMLDALPDGVPVLGTTATANDRVVADVSEQLGQALRIDRGPLGRDGLRLRVAPFWSSDLRLAWLAENLPKVPGSGIVYCLTIRDTEIVAEWLRTQGVDAVAYSGMTPDDERQEIEARLSANTVKAVVATSALGMGYDKPDLSFVVHFQAPGSAIAYYQQVGRAGRGLDRSYGVLLQGPEDEDIQNHFIDVAFPPEHLTDDLLAIVSESDEPVKVGELEARLNLRRARLDAVLKVLEVEEAVERDGTGWRRTDEPWAYPRERVERVTQARRDEQQSMRDYRATTGCLMRHLRGLLDDPESVDCGICMNCVDRPLERPDADLVAAARSFLGGRSLVIEPRKRWPPGLDPPGPLDQDHQIAEGRSLCAWADPTWGAVVRAARADGAPVTDELVTAAAELVTGQWSPDPAPTWVTGVPSSDRPDLVPDVGRRLADALGLPWVDAVVASRPHEPQATMDNSAQQVLNVLDAFTVEGDLPDGPVLLVDDVVASRWTMTVVGWLLREAGVPAVLPFALAESIGR